MRMVLKGNEEEQSVEAFEGLFMEDTSINEERGFSEYEEER
jgi:hypothetical protein